MKIYTKINIKQYLLSLVVFSFIIFALPFISNGATVLTDSFTGTTIDTNKWIEVDAGGIGGTVGSIQQNNVLTIVGDDTNWGGVRLVSNDDFLRSSAPVLQVDFSVSASNIFASPIGYGPNDIFNHPTNENYMLVVHNSGFFYLVQRLNNNWEPLANTGVSVIANRRYRAVMNIGVSGGVIFELYQDTNGDGDFNDSGEDTDLFAGTTNSISTGTFPTGKFIILSRSSLSTTTIYNATASDSSATSTAPEAPTVLNATAGDGQATLAWTAGADNGSAITDYIVEYKLSTAGSWSTFADGTSINTNAIVTGLSNGYTYNFRVSAVNANGTSPVSSTSSAMPISAVATTPTALAVTISGTASVGQILTGNYTYLDVNGDTEDVSTYRWLSADTVEGVYSAISGATSINYTITSSDLEKYIKFEVTPSSNVSPTTGDPVLSSATTQVVEAIYFNHILSTGQSLSTGTNGSPALSTTQPYNNKMLSGTSLVPLLESSVETMSSAMANTLTALSPGANFQSAVTRHGVGGTAYSGLKKGTSPYNNGITQTTNVKNAAQALGMVDRVIGVTTIHGESDQLAGNGGLYKGYLEEWQSDYDTDIKAITGQVIDIPLFTDQMSSYTWYNSAFPTVTLDQLAAAEDNPGKIVLVTPKYFFTYSNSSHLTNIGYRWLGEYYGKVMKKVVIDNESWRPLSPDTIIRSGNIIYANFHVPAGVLAFDTTIVSPRTNYGFEYYDDTSSANISTVEILDDDTVKITLDGIPTGANQRLRYAYTGVPTGVSGTVPGAQIAGAPAGNLRDTDSTPSLYGNTLYNWAVHFDKAITEDSIAPAISSILSTPTETSTTITWTTDELASSIIDYGLNDSYGSSILETDTSPRVTSHSVTISGLVACTTYNYRVKSNDGANNQATSINNTFTTLGCTGEAEVTDENQNNIETSTGGTVDLMSGSQGISLSIPAGATNVDAIFQIKSLDQTQAFTESGMPSGMIQAGDYAFDLKALTGVGTKTTSFLNPIEITMTYQDSDIVGIDESSLLIYRYDGTTWSPLSACVVNTSVNTITCSTLNFSVFSLFGTLIPTPISTRSTTSSGSTVLSRYNNLLAMGNIQGANELKNQFPNQFNSTQINPTFPITESIYPFIKTLKKGMTDIEVKELQKYLNTHGYPVSLAGGGSIGNETLYFGPLTKKAVIKFQLANNLIGDGIVGPLTREKIK